MIITCPNCATHYNVQPALIGKGRSTRCYNCGHTWHQGPVLSPPPPPMQPQPLQLFPTPLPTGSPQVAGYPQPIPGDPNIVNMQYPYGQHPQFAAQPTAMEGGIPPIPPQQTGSDPELIKEASLEDSNLNIETEGKEAEEGSDNEPDITEAIDANEKTDSNEPETDPISDAELDEMFGDEDNLPSVSSIMGGGGNQNNSGIDPEDMPEPEPLPQMINPQEAGDSAPAKRSLIKIIGIGFSIFLIALLAALYFLRGIVIEFLPFTNDLYKIIGLGEKIGAGLNLGKPKIEYGTKDEKAILVVQGVIANISEDTKSVPMLKVILHDADKNEVQSKIAPPEGNKLPAGKRMRYKITVSEPSPKARGIAVIFVLPEDPKAE